MLLSDCPEINIGSDWRGSIHDVVLRSIVGQMLSSQASASILRKLRKRFRTSIKIIRWAQTTSIRQGALLGLSQKKRKALSSWFEFSQQNKNRWIRWQSMSTQEVQQEIVSLWGFGPWTADMIAIFYLGRKDVFPKNDAGLQKVSSIVFGTNADNIITQYIFDHETATALFFWTSIETGVYDRLKNTLSG
jgi:DNA-3-methyladenine glycosylase II